jgi:protein-disulfide isomerase
MQVVETYGDQVQLVFRDFPLSFHARAHAAAEAAQCAHSQGKFWEYHDALFANQKQLADEDLKRHAADLGLDVDDFNACLETGRFRNDVAEDFQEGQRFGVRGTPAFFVNGRFLSGNQPYEAFAAIIDEELENPATR